MYLLPDRYQIQHEHKLQTCVRYADLNLIILLGPVSCQPEVSVTGTYFTAHNHKIIFYHGGS